jgi:hypothetical protein
VAGQARTADFELDDRAFRRSLAVALKDVKLATERDLKSLAFDVQNRAKEYAAVDTGRLRSSIGVSDGRDSRGYYVTIGTPVVYAMRIEFGFRGVDRLGRRYFQNPQPFLRPALLEAVVGWRPRALP